MALGNPESFDAAHIRDNSFDTSALLAEQAVHSLELVAEMVDAGLSFQFKGGNSLLLILDTPARYSIDADIATDEPRERIEQCLDAVVARYGVFTRWEPRAHKTKPWLPMTSYYCYFHSAFAAGEERAVMFDVQLRCSPYPTEQVLIRCGELYDAPVKARVPRPSGIIGDKLLTLGPRTLGIPVGKGKEAQRLKHAFDVARLLDTRPDLEEIRDSFSGCLKGENDLQDTAWTAHQVMQDTVRYCFESGRHETAPDPDTVRDDALRENARGLVPFAGFLFSRKYTWGDLQRDAARVACCITAVCREDIEPGQLLAAVAGEPAPAVPETLERELHCRDAETVQLFAWASAWSRGMM